MGSSLTSAKSLDERDDRNLAFATGCILFVQDDLWWLPAKTQFVLYTVME